MNGLAFERCEEGHGENCFTVVNYHKRDARGEHLEYARHVNYMRAMSLCTGEPLADLYRRLRDMDREEWQ